jgi:antitoxin MazE
MSKISRWGNSLGVRLPKEIAATAGLRQGAFVTVRLMDNGSIQITPVSGLVTVISEDATNTPKRNAMVW